VIVLADATLSGLLSNFKVILLADPTISGLVL
jgi:hypothetical protein